MSKFMVNSWFPYYHANPSTRIRLFCFPFAGGGASFYRNWSARLPWAEVIAVQLPGRENRIGELPYVIIEDALQALETALLPFLSKPFAFMGYSMGGMLSFHLAQQLQRKYNLTPERLFLAASRPPWASDWRHFYDEESDEALIKRLLSIGGTPEALLHHQELWPMLLPTIRADFQLCSSLRMPDPGEPLSCPITVFGGDDDALVTTDQLQEWRMGTFGEFELHSFAGGHFFIEHHLGTIHDCMTTLLCMNTIQKG